MQALPAAAHIQDLESLRYRYQVMLLKVAAGARRRGLQSVEWEAESVVAEIKRIPAGRTPAETEKSMQRLLSHTARIHALAARVGVRFDGRRIWPRWALMLAWLGPLLTLLLAVLGVLLVRRGRISGRATSGAAEAEDPKQTTAR